MEYNVIKNANGILNNSKYYVSTPNKYKGKWNDFLVTITLFI